jgi:uncharacterized iron-regulated membrane protein
VTGLYLWWPRQAQGFAGVLWPRFKAGRKTFWRDIHAVIGVWVSGFAIILLVSGLPWTNVWGDAFKKVRVATGTAPISQDWTQSRSREHEDMGGSNGGDGPPTHHHTSAVYTATIDDIAANARAAQLQPPVLIYPPSAAKPAWRAVSQTQNRPLGATLTFDREDGTQIGVQQFSDKHPIDQAVGVGLAIHEGQLFGLANQIVGLLTALGLTTLCVSAFVLWRRRAPTGVLGAPPSIPDQKLGVGLGVIILAFALFLPVLGLSLITVAVVERLVIARSKRASKWLGLDTHAVPESSAVMS